MSKYDEFYFVGDNQMSPSRFFKNEESRRIFGPACSIYIYMQVKAHVRI